jgi:hypothetical protein
MAVTGMDKDELKALLRKSKTEPVNCAVAASGDDRTLGVIYLDKVKAPKAVSGVLEKAHKNATLVRWGKAEVDMDIDPKLVIFTLHKNVTGLGKKLKKSLKGTGYTKVLLNFEDGTASEKEMDEEESVEAASESGADTPTSTAQSSQPDPVVTGLAPSGESEGGETESAETTGAPETTASTGAADAALAAKQQVSARTWVTAVISVKAEVEKLKAEVLKTYQGQQVAAEIDKAFTSKVQPVLDSLNAAAAQKLNEASKATDAATQAKLASEARAILAGYVKFVTSEPLIKDLDDNPFVPLTIGAQVIKAVSQVSAQLK